MKCWYCTEREVDPACWPYCGAVCAINAQQDLVIDQRAFQTPGVNPMSITLRPMARKCWPKIQHDNLESADLQARSLVQRGLAKGVTLHSYGCPHCGKCHVGHTRTDV